MRKNLSIRYISKELGEALDAERERSEKSLNETVLGLLERALGLDEGTYDNGLGNLAGQWSAADLATFENATRDVARTHPFSEPLRRNETPTRSERPATRDEWRGAS